ncbi:uncharacterized protein LOC117120669 [Anneissia japonica]|uniref:uncharacterized protein LOC117120669 n=1 Tax=Anneissia japonica TaxID=1529436 RepID=UPI0014258937|nr:uncharacterized protein LOC117120669 [Anneissia japonica]
MDSMHLVVYLFVIYMYAETTSCQPSGACNGGEQSVCKCEHIKSEVKVNCSGRGLTQLPVGIPTNTTQLYLDHNNLTNIVDDALLRLPSLHKISMNYNKMTTLPMFPKYIKEIYAEHNELQSIDGAFANLSRISQVYLSGNKITVLKNTTFKDVLMISYLEIDDNPLEVIEPYTFAPLIYLYFLDLKKTKMQALSENSLYMSGDVKKNIYLGNSLITNLSTLTFNNIPSGSVIKLSRSQIVTIPARVINGSFLDTLDLSSNRILYIDPDAFVELNTILDLYLFDNLLTVFPRALFKLHVTQLIDVSWNNISSLGSGPVLKYSPRNLVLTRNKIQTISRDNFSGLGSLTLVLLLQNNITYIADGAFNGTSITHLFVQGNFLSHITNKTFYVEMGTIDYLYIYDNPIQVIENNAFSHTAQNSTVYLTCENLRNIPSVFSEKIFNGYCMTDTTTIVIDKIILLNYKIRLYGIVCSSDGECSPCRPGYYGQKLYVLKIMFLILYLGGFYQDLLGFVEKGNYTANCKRCPLGTFSPRSGAGSVADCQACPTGTKTDQLANLNACDCLRNFHRTDRYGPCVHCPEGVDCTDGVQRLIQGYWWSWKFPAAPGSFENYSQFVANLKSDRFNIKDPDVLKETTYIGLLPAVHACPRIKSCNGGGINANCSKGYSGWLCAACSHNHYQLFNECFKCQHIGVIVTVFVAVTIVLTSVGYVVWKLDRRGRGRNGIGSFMIHMKIAINFYQILGILSEVNEIHWPEDFQSVGESLQYLDIVRYINILSPRCIFSDSWNAYTLLYIAIATPFIIVALTSLVFFLWHILNRYRGDLSAHHLKDKCLSIIIMILYLTYASTCSNIMAVGPWSIRTFYVTEDGGDKKRVLTSDYSIDVEDGSVYDFNKNIVYCSLVYVLYFPIFVIIVLYCRYKRPEEQPETLEWKFFSRPYSDKFWYWEIFEMYNKAVLAFIANFKDDQESNMSYSLFVTTILIAIHLYVEPLKAKSDQRFQLLTLVYVIVNLSVGAIIALDETLYMADNTISVLHDITPFILLLLNLSILFVVIVDLMTKVKRDIWEEWNHHFEPMSTSDDADLDYTDDENHLTYQDATVSVNTSHREMLCM